MITSRITSIHYTSGSVRKKPQAGDERYLKVRGITQIRQQQMSRGMMMVSGSRPVWEWVEKGSERDRTSAVWRMAQGLPV